MKNKKVLITGCCGFIGFHLSKYLIKKKFFVFGIDNMNNYYNNDLKFDRLNEIEKISKSNFKFIKVDNRCNIQTIIFKLELLLLTLYCTV